MRRYGPFAWQEDERKFDHESARQLSVLHSAQPSSYTPSDKLKPNLTYLQRLHVRRSQEAAIANPTGPKEEEEMLVERGVIGPTRMRSRQSVSWKPELPPASTIPPSLPGLKHETAAHPIWAYGPAICPCVQLSASRADVVYGDVWVHGVAMH
jgi:hypothetical protein